ncbi:MAG: HD domain-containing protein [Lachnospiraceae bacterium]|nr:HD domain-containing protein [Lachnospiraceae bacterium]
MWYYAVCGLAALIAFVMTVITYKRKTHMAFVTGTMFLFAGAVNLAYLARIGAHTYFAASLTTSVYFVCLDFLVLFMVYYMVEFTQIRILKAHRRKLFVCAVVFLIFVDSAVLIVNVFHELILRYQYHAESIYAIRYMYESEPVFSLHLALVYLLVAVMLFVLLYKTLSIPKIYRSRYKNTFLALCAIGILTVLYMTGWLKIAIDVSVPVYGFICLLFYRNAFDYSSKGMLNTTRKMILEYLGTPMILFDYEGYVADTNKDMRDLFPVLDNHETRLSLLDFLQIGSFVELRNTNTNQRFAWENPGNVGARTYQCDFTCLKDEKGKSIGHLLVMKNMETERDMLTQLYSKNSFYTEMDKVLAKRVYPVTVVVCNTNGIGLVNDVYGWKKGNELLRQAADLLRENLPQTAILARLADGDMAAAFPEVEQEYAERLFENIKEQYRQANDTGISTDIEYGIAVIRDEAKSLDEALKEAGDSMSTKKLMNQSSQKSSLLDSLTQTLTESDYETEEHVERTREMAIRLGRAMRLSDGDLGKLALLAVLHDIGKIAIPHAILLKPGKLTAEEWEVMKTHTEKGYRIASASKELQPIGQYILHHHERWDGGGYPGGLAGEEIPLLSRIITIVDSHDVMVHDRPYHKAMNEEDAEAELRRCAGTQFDPQLVEAFLEVLKEEQVS